MSGSPNKVILLVEDNDDDVELTRRALDENSIRTPIVVLGDGAEAVDWLERTGHHAERDPRLVPQVILLDLKLPKLTGFDVLKRIRANAATSILPVVMLTSSREESDLLRSYRLGANSYIVKPVSFVEFKDAVNTLGVYWLALNEPPPGG